MRAYDQLKTRIEAGELAAGTRLNIGLLADEFGTGRDSVKRALGMLGNDGLVERYAGLGWYVAEHPA